MTAYDEARGFGERPLRDLGAQLGAVYSDVGQQDAKLEGRAVDHFEYPIIGDVRGMDIDVAAYGKHGSHFGQIIENAELADVTRVQDGVGPKIDQALSRRRMRPRMGVGYYREAESSVAAHRERNFLRGADTRHA